MFIFFRKTVFADISFVVIVNYYTGVLQEWGAEGYHLWLSLENSEPLQLSAAERANGSDSTSSSSPEPHESVSTPPEAPQTPVDSSDSCASRGSFDFMQLQFVKSSLTVNPCSVGEVFVGCFVNMAIMTVIFICH